MTPGSRPGTLQRSTPVGVDPVTCAVIANHDQAYHLWRECGFARRVLVHIDAHHDMWWADGIEALTAANFISLALQHDIVREAFWIVPDASWESEAGRQAISHHLRKIVGTCTRVRQRARSIVREDSRSMTTDLFGKTLTVCGLESLPCFQEEVLLDIDVDFLVIRRVSSREPDEHGALPWCWPDELVARLSARELRADLVTIA